ncbi:MAG: type III-A CRISPR-associated protein Cas10/Csm1 [Candidatus Poribacteria bacterium]|nr:type III-A CRISPR-associated protein Cas10/Csm1 [Candidatus Poribacteria bacterium]
MIQDIERLQLAALLHDIGKFRQRTIARSPYRPHEEHGWDFVTEEFRGFFSPCGDDLSDAILNHHKPARQRKEIEKQVTLADRLSAKERETEQRDQERPSHAALVSILSRLQIPDTPAVELRYNLNPLYFRRESIFPTGAPNIEPGRYKELWVKFTQELQRLAGDRGYQTADYQTLVALLHKYTVLMPSATPWERDAERTVPDVSLYDHLRTTAAIAGCIHRELTPDDLDDYRQRHFPDRPVCSLIKGDLSGIQKFLYGIKSEGASRELRGRSFYLQLLTEAIALWILRRFDLPITNLLLASGGHFYLLLPDREAKERIDQLRNEIAEKLWDAHREDLSIVLARISVTASNFDSFSERWDLVSKEVEHRKRTKGRELSKETMFDRFFTPRIEGGADDYGFRKLGGDQLRKAQYLVTFGIPDQPLPDSPDWCAIIRSFGLDVHLVNKLEAKPPLPPNATRATVYRLNDTNFLSDGIREGFRWGDLPVSYDFRSLPQVIPRKPESDAVADFDQLAEASDGVKWLSVLRMDIDNLGLLFEKGFGKSATISRMSALSESIRLFFEGYIPQLCRDYNANHTPQILELIYAGGDDLFLVGGWSAAPEIARQIRDDFRAFVGGEHITLSGGIAIEHKKYPLYQLAEDAGKAVDTAKEKEKNALSFLQKRMTWKEFSRVDEWYKRLCDAVSGGKPLPNSFLTRFGEIYYLYVSDTESQRKWAWRLIYHLGRAKQMNRDHRALIDDLRRELIVNHSEAGKLLQFLHVIARWTTLRTRKD